jgi:hypothetical protein
MSRKKVEGICCICGIEGPLSFEHVPPSSIMGTGRVLTQNGTEIFQKEFEDVFRGKINQRGSGGFTLCVRCNNQTGHWYGTGFAHWSFQAARILLATKNKPTLHYPYRILPLRIIKQVACMFFSTNGSGFQSANKDLVKFVLDRDERHLPRRFRIYTFYHNSQFGRKTGVVGNISLYTGDQKIFSEVAFPPLGYLMTINSKPPDDELFDITFFSESSFMDYREVSLKIPFKDVFTGIPGDYRNQDEFNNNMKD